MGDPKSVKILTEMRNVFCLAMKVADLFHCSRPLEMHHRWVDLITEEFFTQGDLETEKGLKISPGWIALSRQGLSRRWDSRKFSFSPSSKLGASTRETLAPKTAKENSYATRGLRGTTSSGFMRQSSHQTQRR